MYVGEIWLKIPCRQLHLPPSTWTIWRVFSLSHNISQDKNDWRLTVKGANISGFLENSFVTTGTNYSVLCMRTKFGDRAFSVAQPVVCNSLSRGQFALLRIDSNCNLLVCAFQVQFRAWRALSDHLLLLMYVHACKVNIIKHTEHNSTITNTKLRDKQSTYNTVSIQKQQFEHKKLIWITLNQVY